MPYSNMDVLGATGTNLSDERTPIQKVIEESTGVSTEPKTKSESEAQVIGLASEEARGTGIPTPLAPRARLRL